MSDFFEDWGEGSKRDFVNLFLGKKLGGGMSRNVYEFTGRPDMVIKLEHDAGHFQNVTEWVAWNEIKGSPFEKYFAPCFHISDYGTVLIQARTEPLSKGRIPKQMPSFVTDLKTSNFGIYKGRIVVHDYAINMALTNAINAGRMRKIKKSEFY